MKKIFERFVRLAVIVQAHSIDRRALFLVKDTISERTIYMLVTTCFLSYQAEFSLHCISLFYNLVKWTPEGKRVFL